DGVCESVALRPLADMAGEAERLPPRLARDLLGERDARVRLAAGDHDGGTVTREGARDLATEPAAAAGEDRDLAGQVELRHARPLPASPAPRFEAVQGAPFSGRVRVRR